MLADQDAHAEGVFVDFMGRKASNHPGPAVFALRTGAPILFGSAIRQPDGRHLFDLQLLRVDDLKEVTPENILKVTQAYTSLLERRCGSIPTLVLDASALENAAARGNENRFVKNLRYPSN